MPNPLDIAGAVSGILKPVHSIIDELKFSGEEKAKSKLALYGAEITIASRMLEYEADALQAKASIVVAEAQGKGLQAQWRPITALSFVAIILYNIMFQPILQWLLTWLAPHVSPLPIIEIPGWIGACLTVMIGGYVTGRTAEKITKDVMQGGGISFKEVFKRKKKGRKEEEE